MEPVPAVAPAILLFNAVEFVSVVGMAEALSIKEIIIFNDSALRLSLLFSACCKSERRRW